MLRRYCKKSFTDYFWVYPGILYDSNPRITKTELGDTSHHGGANVDRSVNVFLVIFLRGQTNPISV